MSKRITNEELAFTKGQRLLSSPEFDRVFKKNQLRVSNRYCLILAAPNKYSIARLGLVIAKKNIRLAVQRNRVKRMIRESFRLQQHQLPAFDILVLARKGQDQLDNRSIAKAMGKLWQSLQQKALS